jgi:hypothetical protein
MCWVAFGEPLGSINRIFSTEFLSVISMRRIKREAVLARHAHWDRVTYCLSSNVKWRVVGRTSYGVTCLRGALGRDRSVGPAAGEGAMTNFEDHELAQAICRELLELRARTNAVTPVELSVLAAKAELPRIGNLTRLRRRSMMQELMRGWRSAVLPAKRRTMRAGLIKVNTAPLWDVAIDRVQAWVAEEG